MTAQFNQNTTGSAGSVSSAKVNITQLTSNSTGVTANGLAGTITMFAALAAIEQQSFVFTNSNIVSTTKLKLSMNGQTSRGILTSVNHGAAGAGSVTLYVYNPDGTTATSAAAAIDYELNV